MEKKTTRRAIAATQADQAYCQVIVDPLTGFRSLITTRPLKKGQVVSAFTHGALHRKPNYLTVQTGEHRHIELAPTFLECINHSCDPNVEFNLERMEVIALKDIPAKKELTYFYPSTEWDMDQSFVCQCKTKRCLGIIQGARYIADEILTHYALSPFIREKKHQH
jgi:hypothetical protein